MITGVIHFIRKQGIISLLFGSCVCALVAGCTKSPSEVRGNYILSKIGHTESVTEDSTFSSEWVEKWMTSEKRITEDSVSALVQLRSSMDSFFNDGGGVDSAASEKYAGIIRAMQRLFERSSRIDALALSPPEYHKYVVSARGRQRILFLRICKIPLKGNSAGMVSDTSFYDFGSRSYFDVRSALYAMDF